MAETPAHDQHGTSSPTDGTQAAERGKAASPKVTISGAQSGRKLSVPNLVTIGIFVALYFLACAVMTFTVGALVPVIGMILLPAATALVAGAIYFMLIAKVPKFGGITAMGLVMGIFFFMSGHFVVSFAANVACGIAADAVARAGRYKSRALNMVSYVVFSYGLMGPILPMWLMKDAYVANLVARGKDSAYIDTFFAGISSGTLVLCLVATLVCAIVGALFGQWLLERHLKKANLA